jgi:hypothetical protein
MDPDETKRQYEQALRDGDRERAAELRDALREWKAQGGYAPKGGFPPGV